MLGIWRAQREHALLQDEWAEAPEAVSIQLAIQDEVKATLGNLDAQRDVAQRISEWRQLLRTLTCTR